MSLSEIGTPSNSYTFASGDIDDYLNDFSTPLQESGVSTEIEDVPETDHPEKQEIQCTASVARATGKLLATVTDSTIPAILCTISKSNDISLFKASDVERDELERAWTEYTKLRGGDIPPGIALLLVIGSTYGAKLPMALMMGKQKDNGKNS